MRQGGKRGGRYTSPGKMTREEVGWGGERRGGLQGKKNKAGDKNSIELGTPRALM